MASVSLSPRDRCVASPPRLRRDELRSLPQEKTSNTSVNHGRGYLCNSGLFFFSSRRRHTRCLSDWSSDVCSSDLGEHRAGAYPQVNPQALLPTLELDDGARLTQSLAIIEYLDETHPEPRLIPKDRSEEHTSELQSLRHIVCRLLLEKKKITHISLA